VNRQKRLREILIADLHEDEKTHRPVKIQVIMEENEFVRIAEAATRSRIPISHIARHLLRLWAGRETPFHIRGENNLKLSGAYIYTPRPGEILDDEEFLMPPDRMKKPRAPKDEVRP